LRPTSKCLRLKDALRTLIGGRADLRLQVYIRGSPIPSLGVESPFLPLPKAHCKLGAKGVHGWAHPLPYDLPTLSWRSIFGLFTSADLPKLEQAFGRRPGEITCGLCAPPAGGPLLFQFQDASLVINPNGGKLGKHVRTYEAVYLHSNALAGVR
jgi:hypothetical protein